MRFPLLRFRRRAAAAFFCAASMALAVSAQTFKQPTVVPTGNWPTTFLAADLNADGKTDLTYFKTATTSYNGVSYPSFASIDLLQGASGAFTTQAGGFGGAFTSVAIASGNLRSQGVADLIFAYTNAFASGQTTTQTIGINYQVGIGAPGAGGVGAGAQFTAQGSALPIIGSIATGDFNNDGKLDVAITDSANGYLYILLNNGGNGNSGGYLTLTSTIKLTDGTGPLTVADLDHDGKLDILLMSQTSGVVSPFYGIGDGTFRADYVYTLPNGIFSMLLHDINGDGIPDLIVEGANGALSVFAGTATGISRTAVAISGAQNGTTGNGGHLVAIADLNGDGVPDIITSTPAGISVLLGTPALNAHLPYLSPYTLAGIYNAGPGRGTYALADFNADGHLDLAVDSPEGIAILYGNADGSFQTSRSFAAGQPAYSVALGKFTASGHIDAVLATGVPQLQLLNGDGTGSFSLTQPATPAGNPQTNSNRTLWSQVLVGDFDGDGHLDAAITQAGRYPPTTGDGLTVHFGNGDGTFLAPVSEAQTTGSPHFGVSALGDFNGDGTLDIANLDPGFYGVYSGGSAARTGTMARSLLYGDTTVDNAASSLDLDSYDLIATGFLNPGHTSRQDVVTQDDASFVVYQNNGDGTFFPGPTADATSSATFSAPSNFASVNASTGLFPTTGVFPAALLLQDIDNDGYGDVAILYHNVASNPANPTSATPNQLYLYWGQGNRNFAPTPTILTLDRNYYQLTIADIDGDGLPDLILSDGYLIAVMRNTGNHTFGPATHYLAGMGINQVLAADINGDGSLDIVTANGGLVNSHPVVTAGVLASNGNVNTGAVTAMLNSAQPRVVTGSVTATPEPSPYGVDFTLNATLTAANGTTPSGSVTFSIDGASVGTATVSGGAATLPITAPTYLPGTHTLTAAYSGDMSNNATTLTGSHTVSYLQSATTFTNTTPTIYYGQIVDGVGSVGPGPQNPNASAPLTGGTITFYDGSTNICVLPSGVNGTVTCPASAGAGFDAGTHILTAVFSGNTYYSGSTSPPTYTVVLPDTTNTGILGSLLNPANAGQTTTLVATFTAPYATPAGPVTFYDGTTPIGIGNLNSSGVATFATSSLAVGTHTITASYAATLDFTAATTNPVQQVILFVPIATNVALASSSNPSAVGQSVTFAAVATTASATTIPAGLITFLDGTTVLGTGTLNASGVATYTTTTLALGSHNITASYPGSTTTLAAVSPILTQVVNAPSTGNGFTLTVTPAAVSVPIGSAVSVVVTVTTFGSFAQPVALTCSGLTDEATCTFDTATLPAAGGATRLTVAAAAPHTCGTTTPYFVSSGPTSLFGLLATAALAFCLRRRRRVLQLLMLVVAIGILPLLSGCGHCTDLGVRPGNYSFTVTGTSTGSPTTTASQTLQMVAHL